MVAVATLFTFGLANAQFGVQAGYSMSKPTLEDATAFNGFHIGPTYELGIQGPLSINLGLLYDFTTQKIKDLNDANWTNHSFDIPVRISAAFPLSTGVSAFVFGGPNFNIGLANKIHKDGVSVDLYGDAAQQILEISGAKFSRFDLQLGLGAGIKFNNMGIKASYDFGMLNRVKNSDPAFKVNDLKVSLFYNF